MEGAAKMLTAKLASNPVIRTMFPCETKVRCFYRIAHTTGHGTYFIAEWAEGHGVIAFMSLALLILMLSGMAIKEIDGE
jgi:hypothetical protein